MVKRARSWLRSTPLVGAPPGVQAGLDQANAYSYGAAGQALSEGQAIAAWGALAQAQNTPQIKSVAAQFTCPSGWLISPDGTTCVNQRNVHIALADRNACGSGAVNWFDCSELPLWYTLNAPDAYGSLGAAKSVLPRALTELGYLEGAGTPNAYAGGWSNVKASVHALARHLASGIGGDPVAFADLSQDEVEAQLSAVAVSTYDAAIAKGGVNPPTWLKSLPPGGSSKVGLGLALAGAGALALSFIRPDLALAAMSFARALPARVGF